MEEVELNHDLLGCHVLGRPGLTPVWPQKEEAAQVTCDEHRVQREAFSVIQKELH